MTRYDIVGHSQGGVILRYLAQPVSPQPNSDAFAFDGHAFLAFPIPPFKSLDNYYRGRFDRIVTIRSPHNGSLNYYYSYVLSVYGTGLLDPWASWLFDAPGNNKFDPFGQEMKAINSDSLATDPDARFHCVRTRIFGGIPPDEDPQLPPVIPMAYYTLDSRVPETLNPVALYQNVWPGLLNRCGAARKHFLPAPTIARIFATGRRPNPAIPPLSNQNPPRRTKQ